MMALLTDGTRNRNLMAVIKSELDNLAANSITFNSIKNNGKMCHKPFSSFPVIVCDTLHMFLVIYDKYT